MSEDWKIFRGDGVSHKGIERLPAPPPWRAFIHETDWRGATFQGSDTEIEMVNAALYLRRPLLVSGRPGSGKSSLAYAVARELGLGKVLVWSINSRSTLAHGLYEYDAIARLRDANLADKADKRRGDENGNVEDIGSYIKLGPLGTALLPSDNPRVLLIDEIDKSDIDLANDLLHAFEEGEYEIPELIRISDKTPIVNVWPHQGVNSEDRVKVERGRIRCTQFPFILLTSNDERELPAAFYRRCLRLRVDEAEAGMLTRIAKAHLPDILDDDIELFIADFVDARKSGPIATDQLLNALYLFTRDRVKQSPDLDRLKKMLFRALPSQ